MIESDDMAMLSTSDAIPVGNDVSLSEEKSSTEKKESEKMNSHTNSAESTSTQTPKEETDTAISFDDDSTDHSQTKDQREGGETEGAVGGNSPVGRTTSEVDAFPNRLHIDVDTNVVAFQSESIEPEGTTPRVSKTSQRFDDDVLDKVLSESQEMQEDKEGANQARMKRTEIEDAMTIPKETVIDTELNFQETVKKKRQEPPGNPAKHERKKSETADERERRIKDTINDDLKELDDRRVHQILLDERRVVEEKKGDDEISLQREPSGPLISLNTVSRESWENNSDQGKQPTKIVENEKPKEISMIEEMKVDMRYESPTVRKKQRQSQDFDNNHIVHPVSHAPNQYQNYSDSMRQSTLPLSPAFFVEDDESIPIPHLPPLMVPGLGPSYDALPLQGQGQQVHLNHNGYQQQFHQRPSLISLQQQQPHLPVPNHVTTMAGGKRKIHLHLWEDVSSIAKPETSSFLSFRRTKGILRRSPQQSTPMSELDDASHNKSDDNNRNGSNKINHWKDRGTLTVSWYEGTSSLELQEHVQNTVIRKLGFRSTTKLTDFRVLDESSDPPEGTCFGFILFSTDFYSRFISCFV